jgi:hypothetical protein
MGEIIRLADYRTKPRKQRRRKPHTTVSRAYAKALSLSGGDEVIARNILVAWCRQDASVLEAVVELATAALGSDI